MMYYYHDMRRSSANWSHLQIMDRHGNKYLVLCKIVAHHSTLFTGHTRISGWACSIHCYRAITFLFVIDTTEMILHMSIEDNWHL